MTGGTPLPQTLDSCLCVIGKQQQQPLTALILL